MMFNKLREALKVLFAPQVIYKLVEVPKQRPSIRWDQNVQDSVSTLSSHPGFVSLMERLNLTKTQLVAKNNTQWKKDLREADFLQSGIFWCNWLEEQVSKSTIKGSQRKYVDPMQEELDAFKELDAHIERVGMDESQS